MGHTYAQQLVLMPEDEGSLRETRWPEDNTLVRSGLVCARVPQLAVWSDIDMVAYEVSWDRI